MAQAASPLVYELLSCLAVLDVPGVGRLKSCLWVACGERDLTEFDAAIDMAVERGWLSVDGAHVELTPLGLAAVKQGSRARADGAPHGTPQVPAAKQPRRPLPRWKSFAW